MTIKLKKGQIPCCPKCSSDKVEKTGVKVGSGTDTSYHNTESFRCLNCNNEFRTTLN